MLNDFTDRRVVCVLLPSILSALKTLLFAANILNMVYAKRSIVQAK